jgi:hypothetical protein
LIEEERVDKYPKEKQELESKILEYLVGIKGSWQGFEFRRTKLDGMEGIRLKDLKGVVEMR